MGCRRGQCTVRSLSTITPNTENPRKHVRRHWTTSRGTTTSNPRASRRPTSASRCVGRRSLHATRGVALHTRGLWESRYSSPAPGYQNIDIRAAPVCFLADRPLNALVQGTTFVSCETTQSFFGARNDWTSIPDSSVTLPTCMTGWPRLRRRIPRV